MEEKKTSFIYKIIRWFVWLFSPKFRLLGRENLPEEPCVVVGNHCQMFGPIAGELFFPGRHEIWCAGEMMRLKEVPAYAYEDFWSFKPKAVRWFFRLASYLIAPLSVCVFNNAHTIPVYHDVRLRSTYRLSMDSLDAGENLIIFPEHNRTYNHILYDFQERFLDLARFYHKKTGKELQFVPLYIAPRLSLMILGRPIRYCASGPIEEERRRIKTCLMQEITALAESLPEHTVIPYRNIRKRDYPRNHPPEVCVHEKASR